MAQSVILCLKSRGLILQSLHSVAQIGVLLAGRRDLPLLFLYRLDDGDARGGLRKVVAKYHQVLGVNRGTQPDRWAHQGRAGRQESSG